MGTIIIIIVIVDSQIIWGLLALRGTRLSRQGWGPAFCQSARPTAQQVTYIFNLQKRKIQVEPQERLQRRRWLARQRSGLIFCVELTLSRPDSRDRNSRFVCPTGSDCVRPLLPRSLSPPSRSREGRSLGLLVRSAPSGRSQEGLDQSKLKRHPLPTLLARK